MMWRLNFLVFWACLVLRNDYMLYYICPMHTLFTVFVYATLGIASRLNKSHAGIAFKIGVVTALVVTCWESKTVFYTLWTPFLWLVGYNDPRKPSDDLLHGVAPISTLARWAHMSAPALTLPLLVSPCRRHQRFQLWNRDVCRLCDEWWGHPSATSCSHMRSCGADY